jgi:thiamine kinase-like enzyme
MITAYDFTTEYGLYQYLVDEGSYPETIQLLPGGSDYVFRVSFQYGKTSIFKHADPNLGNSNSFAFDARRLDYEAAIVNTIATIESPELVVCAAEFFEYDSQYKLLNIADGGQHTLKDNYKSLVLNMREIAFDLGKWLCTLHSVSRSMFIGVPWQNFTLGAANNNPIPECIYRHTYNNLHFALTKYGHNTQLAAEINEKFGSLLATDNECLCQGDFCPENILMRSTDPHFNVHNSGRRLPDLTIVDWQLSRQGSSATDVGQFAAEAFFLDRFRGAGHLCVNFLDAYVLARRWAEAEGAEPIGRAWIKRMAVHWAVHVAYWATEVEWTDQKGTQKLIDIGVGILEAVLADDWESLERSVLFRDVSSVWMTAFLLE